MGDDILMVLRQEFLEETGEFLQEIENNLLILEKDNSNQEAIGIVKRLLHNIKGSANAADLEVISTFVHDIESNLTKILNQHRNIPEQAVDALLKCIDSLKYMLMQLEKTGEITIGPENILRYL